MRKNELRRVANTQLNRDKSGSHRDQKYRLFVINKVIHDLFKIKQYPVTWYELNAEQILSLILYWKKQQIKIVTIMRYMTFIRYFLRSINHHIDNINNKTLGLSRSTNFIPRQDVSADNLQHPISKLIFEFQSKIGLTFSETIRLIPDLHINNQSLWLTRDITFNSQDRVIPLRNEAQLHLYKQLRTLTGDNHSLISAHGYHAILAIYRHY